jgi:hypothetical protein
LKELQALSNFHKYRTMRRKYGDPEELAFRLFDEETAKKNDSNYQS